MDAMPRDMQLSIVRKLDMDGRIACGVIGKIRPPAPLAERIGKVLAYKTYVQATNGFVLLGQPYNNYIGMVGRSHPTEWLDRWHAQELPRYYFFLNVFRAPKYAWMQKLLPTTPQWDGH